MATVPINFLAPILISGIILQGIVPTLTCAASTITSDGTMGTNLSQAGKVYNIDGGTIRGSNQFHSFGLFSVGTGDTASFNGPPVISNIIGRVTGGQQSVIDGLLKSTIAGANLYLLNPSGILFGPNAALNVSGSFHVSTADYLRMADGGSFYADLGKQSTLSAAPVTAFGFLNSSPAAISIEESYLEVSAGKTLSILGGDITITGGPTSALVAPSGRINIASVASPGEVIPLDSRNAPDLQMSSFDRLGNINLHNSAYLDVSSSSGNGTVVIRGGKLLIENSFVVADTFGDIDGAKVGIDIGIKEDLVAHGGWIVSSTYGAGQGGDVVIRSGSMEMKSSVVWSSAWDAGSSGNAEVHTGSLDMSEGSQIRTTTFSFGNAGNVTVTADSILMTGAYDPSGVTTGVYSITDMGSAGRGGGISITTGSLEVRDGATIFTSTYGSGAGGNLDIHAEDILVYGKNAKGFSAEIAAWSNGDGNAGGIRINTGNLEVRDGYISTSSGLSGKAGDLEVTATERILLTAGTGLLANGYSGDSGHIRIKAGRLEVTEGAQIMSNSSGSGAAGNIEVTADSMLLSGFDSLGNRSSISSSVVSDHATGAGGDIRINARSLEVKEGATIFGATIGPGNGGRIELNAESVLISDAKDGYSSSLITSTASGGKGGDIRITTKSLEVKNGGWIEASTYGSGNSGSINVTADNVVVSGVSEGEFALIWALAAGPGASGKGGVIRIAADNLQVKDGGQISASTLGQGDGGSLIVTAKHILLDGGSHTEKGVGLYADTYGSGKAGDIDITTNALEMRGLAQISTSTRAEGQGGSLRINADQVILSGAEGNVSTGLYSVAEGSGNGGDIQMTAGSLKIYDGALISSSSKSLGKAGNISLTAPQITMANGGAIEAYTAESGAGGSIQLSGNQMQLMNGTSIAAESLGTGSAGDITINAGNTLQMQNSSMTTEATQADGGNIQVNAGYMVNLIDSRMTASVGGGPTTVGGNITIDPHYVVLNDSSIIANAYEGKGGNIRITADVFLSSPESLVSASSQLGINGTVDIRSPVTNISGTLAPVRGTYLQSSEMLRDRCMARIQGSSQSSLTVSGRQGLPPRPGTVLPAPVF